MGKRAKDKIFHLIDELGFWEVKNMIGVDVYDLFRISGHPINCDAAGYILYELGAKKLLPKKYKKFSIEYDFDGILNWYVKLNNVEIKSFATPFWDGDCDTPVDIIIFDDDGNEEEFFEKYGGPEVFENLDELLGWFKDIYLPRTYHIIKKIVNDNYTELDF